MDPQLLALAILVIAMLVLRAVMRERREYARFKRLRTTAARVRVLRRWLVESVLVMGGLSAVVLLATSELVPAALHDAQARTPLAEIRAFFGTPLGGGIAIGLGIGVVVALVLPLVLLRRTPTEEVPMLGDIGALIPRARRELPYGAGLALSAGVFEELLFRLALPALVFGLWPSGPLAFALAVLLFGGLHLYQGATGVLMATLLGSLFACLYLVSGSILLPIAVHALINLRTLVLMPLLLGRVWSRTG